MGCIKNWNLCTSREYILELDVVKHASQVVQIDYTKLHMIRPYITTDNMDIWISKMISLSRSDLRKEIKEERQGLLLF